MPYLNRNQIKSLIDEKCIFSNKSINTHQLQPASLDLTISNTCYRIKASFIPNNRPISKIISELMLAKIDLSKEFLLERNCIYLCEINEKLKLPKEIKGKANPKSTTGRLDIFTRIITEHGSEYDFIDYNYKGKLYLEIIPQSFSIKIKNNISLNQIRFYKGPKGESTQREQKISVNIKKGTVSAYKAKKITSAIDMGKINYYEKDMYWEKIIPKEDYFIIEKDEFYILRSKERIIIPNDSAAELEPFNDSFGNFRVHYAGFFDPGFGNDNGLPAVLELRAYDTPFIIRDGQLVGQLNYYKIEEIKNNFYGRGIKSNYHNQSLKLAKQFK
ncbi:2'-deoxycytidine 5'-triphosphate deaminase [Alphaproteobacteria bacterium]|nr:2'-deoxycytidine 5'-triphosphate deaminase [Alphaproteobacteria bacterium]